MREYRKRIYRHYVYAQKQALAPSTVDGLGPRRAFFRKLIRDHFPKRRDPSILELGAGHGALLYFLHEAGYRSISGVDSSAEQVSAASRLGIPEVRQADLLDTLRACADESHDVVVSFDVVEHFGKGKLMGLLDEVHRILKNIGRWIIHTPNGESPFAGRMRYWDFTHELALTARSAWQVLLASSFSRVVCFEDAPGVHGIKSALRWLLWKIIRCGLRVWIMAGTGATDGIFSQNFLVVLRR